ncbi:MAG: exopolysaccharide biosynthesis polyprenyl glycosylphosphotransferase [Fusobacteriaceae bacterium]
MNHSQNLKARTIYLIIIFAVFQMTAGALKLSLNLSFYGLFILLFMGYYLLDILNFNTNYKSKDGVYSIFLNGIVFYILLLFHRNSKILGGYLLFTTVQVTLRYVFTKVFQENTRVLLLGDGEESRRLKELVLKHHNYKYIGFIEDDNQNALGGTKNLKEVVEKYRVAKLIYIETLRDEKLIDDILDLKLHGLKVLDSVTFIEGAEGKVDLEGIDKKWVLKSDGFQILNNSTEQRIKRALDIIMAIGVLIVGLPFMVVTYFLVKLMDNPKNFISNPAFFKQNRIGLGGKTFQIVKFRSMRIHNPEEHSKYAGKDDDRIPPVGKFIRKTRLDELPQIWNVFCGDMSFVGPRPEWDELGRGYEEKIKLYKLRYAIKPGLTGWAQVMYPYGANLEDTKRKLEYDLYYIKHQNFVMDIMIFFKTVKTVVFGKGM